MRRVFWKWCLFCFVIVFDMFFLSLVDVYAYDYIIDDYDVNIVVNENNTLKINEKIDVDFKVSRHGIFRKIPLKNKVQRLDGTVSNNRVKVSDISVSDKYFLSKNNGYQVIKIGDNNKELIGKKDYNISYLYNLGRDKSKDYDEFYFNLIGSEWDSLINNVTFSITMPKEFDKSKLGFSSGEIGSVDNSLISYNVDGNVITGKLDGGLLPGEALTVRIELPEGYFVGASSNIDLKVILIVVILLAFLLISYCIWRKYGKDNPVIETVEFYPPTGFNSLEIGFLYRGKAENQDVTSLLVYLANKGYIKIVEKDKSEFEILKIKDYDGNDSNEKLFLEGLFAYSDEKGADNFNISVTESDLRNSFYVINNKILANINSRENKNKIFERSSSNKSIFIILMIIVSFCLITVLPFYDYMDLGLLIPSLLFPGLGFTFMFKMLFCEKQIVYVNGKATDSSITLKIFGLVFGVLFGGIPFAYYLLPVLLEDYVYLIIYVFGLICVFGMVICLSYLPKRTSYGNEMLGKLRGFRNFLITAEKDRLEALVMENPAYFYDILPYTYVLGVSEKWIERFEVISLQEPDWYVSSTNFSVVTFGSFMNNTMSSAGSAMTSYPSSNSSSGSFGSGGGFSGGGSGGGGGGSW